MKFSMADYQLDGKVALITGAVYGIGFEIARGLSQAGATIVFNSSRQASVDKGLSAYEVAVKRRLSKLKQMSAQLISWLIMLGLSNVFLWLIWRYLIFDR